MAEGVCDLRRVSNSPGVGGGDVLRLDDLQTLRAAASLMVESVRLMAEGVENSRIRLADRGSESALCGQNHSKL